MKPRRWDPKEKAKIILEGLKGRPVVEICNEYQINQSQYYQWRDQFLSNADKAFDSPKKTSQELRLKSQVHQLRALVGELTIELKKKLRGAFMRNHLQLPLRETSLSSRGSVKSKPRIPSGGI